jgi:hypothetical protein
MLQCVNPANFDEQEEIQWVVVIQEPQAAPNELDLDDRRTTKKGSEKEEKWVPKHCNPFFATFSATIWVLFVLKSI